MGLTHQFLHLTLWIALAALGVACAVETEPRKRGAKKTAEAAPAEGEADGGDVDNDRDDDRDNDRDEEDDGPSLLPESPIEDDVEDEVERPVERQGVTVRSFESYEVGGKKLWKIDWSFTGGAATLASSGFALADGDCGASKVCRNASRAQLEALKGRVFPLATAKIRLNVFSSWEVPGSGPVQLEAKLGSHVAKPPAGEIHDESWTIQLHDIDGLGDVTDAYAFCYPFVTNQFACGPIAGAEGSRVAFTATAVYLELDMERADLGLDGFSLD